MIEQSVVLFATIRLVKIAIRFSTTGDLYRGVVDVSIVLCTGDLYLGIVGVLCIQALMTCCYAYFISKGCLCHSLGVLVVLYFHTDYQIVQIPVFYRPSFASKKESERKYDPNIGDQNLGNLNPHAEFKDLTL